MNNGKLWITPTDNTGIEYTYYGYDNNNVQIQQTTSPDGDTLFNAGPNVYAVKIVNPDGCRKIYQLNIPTPNYGIALNYTDTVACTNAVLSFGADTTGTITTWTWNFGDGSPEMQDAQIASHAYTDSGTYTVTLTGYTDNGCSDTDSVNVMIDEPQSLALVSDKDSVCIGERIHFTATTGNSADTMNWNFGNDWIRTPATQNEVSYVYDTAGVYPVMLSTSYHYCPDENATDTIWVFPYPTVNLGNDTTLCDNGEPVVLHNRAAQPLSYTSLWSTGDTTNYLVVNSPGIYSLTVASDINCKTTDEIKIRKDCYIDIPNTFSPNGDGVNDYFFPRNLLSSGVTKFSMQIYDRWGEKVFDTDNIDGRGWDGRFNGKEQPVGVYVYVIDVTINGERQEKYNGNISLLR
jgi:gliding motility-associated-like protein